MTAPIVQCHAGIQVVRDDLYAGGTKARFLRRMLAGHPAEEFVYASPACGGAQTALATVAAELGKRATVFVAKRAEMHPRAKMVERLGGRVVQVPHGYLNVVQSAARKYCGATGAHLLPFGLDLPEAVEIIAADARVLDVAPDEVWCAAGSGTLARALATAWPNAERHVVQVGRELGMSDVAGATLHIYPRKFEQHAKTQPPFPSDPHYDAKAWEVCQQQRGQGVVVFWNVTSEAQ